MRLNISYDDILDGGEQVGLNSHCQTDFDDIRFVDIDNSTVLPYWVEKKVDGDYCVVWVNVSADAMSDGKILLYYGNPSATSASDGQSTFIFFDALDDITAFNANWTRIKGTDTASLDTTTYDRPMIKIPDTSTSTYTEYERSVSLPTSYNLVMHVDIATDVNQYSQARTKDSAGNRIAYILTTRGSYNSHCLSSDAYHNFGTYALNTVLSYDMYIDPTNRDILKIECSDGSSYTTPSSYGTAADIAKISILGVGNAGIGNAWFSHLYIRRYTSTEPVWSSFSSEHTQTGNTPPSVSNPNPPDGATGVSISITQLSCDITDTEGDTMTWTIETSPNIGSSSGTSGNGTITCAVSGLQYNTTYTWYVNVSDGTDSTNVTYTFTTEQAPPPEISNPQPADGATGVSLSPTLSVDVSSADGSSITVEFYHDAGDNAITDNKQLYLQQRAVYYNGKTYMVFINSLNHPAIVEYNQSTGKISQVVEVDTLTLTNAHGAPSVAVDSSGYIYVSYGDALYDSGYIYIKKSTNPEDISSWESPYTLSTSSYTAYPLIISLSNGHLFSIYRDGSGGEYWKMKRSVDGSTWSTEKTILDFSPDRPYVYPFTNGSRLYFAISYRDSTSDGQRNLYCIYTDDEGSTWYELGSTTTLTLPIDSSDLTPIITSDATEVYGAWCYDNRPYIIVESAGYYKLAYWDGSAWQVKTIIADGSGTTTFKGQGASLYVNESGVIFAYLPIKENGHFNIKEYRSTDSGDTWTKTADITSSDANDYPYPFVPLNRNDSLSDIKLVFMEDDGTYAGDRQTWRDPNNLWCWDGEHSFMAGTDYLIGTDTTASGGTASITWNNRSYDSTYRWYVKAYTPNSETNTSATWHFTTLSQASSPVLSDPSVTPSSGVADYTIFYFNITYSDADGDPPVEIRVNISKTGWYLNASMSYISGDNTTGALYSYSTTLPAGTYDYLFYANDGTYSTVNNPTDQVTVEAQSYSFTVSTADPSGQENFTASATMGAEWNVSASYQTSSISAIQITNTGNVPINISINLTSAPISNVHIKYNTSPTPPSFTQNPYYCDKELTTTPVTVLTIEVGGTGNIWLWADFENKDNPGSYTTSLYISSSFGG